MTMSIKKSFYRKRHIRCPICKTKIETIEKRRIHQGKRRLGRLITCDKCGKSYLRISSFRNKWMEDKIHSLIFYRVAGKIYRIDLLKALFPQRDLYNMSYEEIFKEFIITNQERKNYHDSLERD